MGCKSVYDYPNSRDGVMRKLVVNSVTKAFSNRPILTDIQLRVATGEILGLFGRNGSGKSTLLKILFGTLKADSSDLLLDSKSFDPLQNIQSKTIAYLPQDNFLPQDMKVWDVIPLYFRDGEIQNRIFYDPRIAVIASQKVGTLSYGERRYLEILMVSRLPHPFIFMDEPFSMIEPLYKDAIKQLLVSIKHDKAIVLTDHYYSDVMQITDRNIVINDGKTIEVHSRKELAENGYISERQAL